MLPSTNHISYKEDKKYKLALRLSILVACVFALLTIAQLKGNDKNVLMMSTVAGIALANFIYVLKTKTYKPTFYIISATGIIFPSLSVMFLHELTHFTEWIWISCAILLAFLGTNVYYGMTLVILAFFTSTYFVYFGVNVNIENVAERTTIQLIALNIEFIGAFGSIAYLIYLFNDFYTRSDNALMEINTDLIEKNERITNQDEEKTILVKEIHHRVKNNLQIITSLLRMQSNEIEDESTKKQFNDAINRVMAMSLIHQKLYQENTLAQIELKSYLTNLVDELLNIYNLDEKVNSKVEVSLSEVELKSIVPIGLLLNELVSNTLEHGKSKSEQTQIDIQVHETDQKIILKYSDNGCWKENPQAEKQSFGLELIDLLTEQLEGTKVLEKSEEGTSYTFTLKNLDH